MLRGFFVDGENEEVSVSELSNLMWDVARFENMLEASR